MHINNIKEKNIKKSKKVRIYDLVVKEEKNIQSKSKRIFNKGNFWKSFSPNTCGKGYYIYGFSLMSFLLLFNFFFGKFLFYYK